MTPQPQIPTEIVTPPLRIWEVWPAHTPWDKAAELIVEASKYWVTSEGDLHFGTDYYTSHSFVRGSWSRVAPMRELS